LIGGEVEKSLNERITRSRLLLQNPYAYLDGDGEYSALLPRQSVHSLDDAATQKRRLMGNPYASLAELDEDFDVNENQISELVQTIIGRFSLREINAQKKEYYSEIELEEQARSLQIQLWRDREKIWAGELVPTNPLQVLDPIMALKVIGYECDFQETLGQFSSNGKLVEVAATIDNASKKVSIAHRFTDEVRNYTAAHELGHALLHKTVELHRDKALNGSVIARNGVEFEADKFASFFLMPQKLVLSRFQRMFLTDSFVLDESTAFALGYGDYQVALSKLNTVRDLSRVLATQERFNGVQFKSLAQQFNVSAEAMAIRIKELKLVR
jgi:Zn-dependent peptidase ImmA (M78 family)